MRLLFVSWAWPSHLFPMVPTAWGLRLAGHEVVLACPPSLAPVAGRTGLPVARVGTDVDLTPRMKSFMDGARPRRERRTPLDLFVPVADAMAGDLLRFARDWRPDVIVHDPTTYAAPAVAAALGVPSVRHLWGIDFTYPLRVFEEAAFTELYDRLGAGACVVSGSTPTLDPCPPGLQLPVDYTPVRTAYRPYNGTGVCERGLRGRGDAPRLCVTWGTTSGKFGAAGSLPELVFAAAADLGLDLVFATSGAEAFGPRYPPNWQTVVMQPLNLVLPDCDLVVHPGGSGSALTTVLAGLPQVCLPLIPDQETNAAQLVRAGAGARVGAAGASTGQIRDALTELLDDPSFAAAAAALREQSRALPDPGAGLLAAVGG
ncbi:glycosyltransferase [Amycolatopsis sp. PS_44_ISF1]|uniref:glycosyltransferase n=1 Tax=Amycolatopsis sp. PS_44_ISF1 TaxID=2974917 RepID=UPI0028DEE157|nr:glycosyltransferase [Amycolatopsis sp. PS_44_ISF1]MDT8910086.1 glycosyltransferase [Amycolatopsis sp. PS_44_ISF1]